MEPSEIVKKVLEDISLEARPVLPRIEQLTQNIRRRRQKKEGRPNPLTRDEIVFTENLKKDSRGNSFLQYDSHDQDRILIFATDSNLEVRNFIYILFICYRF